MAKDINVKARISDMSVRINASLSGNVNANANLGQTVLTRGTNDYNLLQHKPRIEGVELLGDLSFPQLNMSRLTNSEIEELLT